MQRYVMAVVGFFVLILSGCFGANPLLTTMEPPPTFETARSELRAISAAANSLLVSDVVVSLSGSDRAGWRLPRRPVAGGDVSPPYTATRFSGSDWPMTPRMTTSGLLGTRN